MPSPSASRHVLAASGRAPAHGAVRTGPADLKERLTVSVRIRRRPGAPDLPNHTQKGAHAALGAAPMTREAFAATYGAAQPDLDQVASFAAHNHLEVVESDAARRTVVLSGNVDQMQKAFAVDLGAYKTETETYRGREGVITLPAELVPIVEGVFGLDNRRMAHPLLRKVGAPASGKRAASPAQGAGAPAQNTTPLTPPQVARLYNFPTTNANGQTIAILEFGGGYSTSDVHTYFTNLGVAPPTLSAILVDGAVNSPQPNDDYTIETNLDIAVAGAAAPGAALAVYFAPWTEQGWVDVVTRAVHDTTHRPSVISISYGLPEGVDIWSQAAINAVSATFQEAALLGVTILAASGDSGSTCGMGDGKAHCLYPGSDPGVTCVGGTTISNVNGQSFKEDTWSDYGTTGGGVSDVFPRPTWQAWAGVPTSANGGGHTGRGIPDIAGNASPNSGYMLYMQAYGGNYGPIGGTSAAAPLYAALVALLNAQMGEPLGFLNLNLYAFAGPYVYRDIADNVSNGTPGYKAGPGWDACTGFGSANGMAVLDSLQGVGKPPALATLGGKLHMVWKGMERDDRIWTSSFNGTAWAPQQQIPNMATSTGVALAEFGGKLFMAWKGMEADQSIWWSSSADGLTWAPQKQNGTIGSSVGPSLATYNGKLIMAWKGVEGDQRLFWAAFNGSAWTPQQVIPNVASSSGPALCVFGNLLYAVWKGEYGDPRLWFSTYDGHSWAPQTLIQNVGASGEVSLAVYQNALYLIWKGQYQDPRLWYSRYNGGAWAPQAVVPNVGTSVGAGLAVFGHALYAAWKGEYGDQAIWFSHFNGNAWAAQQRIAGVGTSPDLLVVA